MDRSLQPPQPLVARLGRGALLTGGNFVLGQALRFGSNLILARLLFPDAFGLMALVTMILFGLNMLSDAGIQQSIMQHRRGDDRAFLDTAFTMNAARGVLLWGLAAALAWPLAQFYDAPELALVLPICGVTLLFNGLTPTRIFTSARHIRLGRITLIELTAQIAGIVLMIALAWATGSYWALVWGLVATSLVKLALEWLWFPGQRDRLHWEREAARDLWNFGGWIMLSSSCGFLLAQGDRAILGYFFTLEQLGLYNIAWFLAAVPLLLATAMTEKMLIPAYRETFASADAVAPRRIRRMRYALSASVLLMLAVLALLGPWLIGVLYDDRYLLSGPMMVLIACALMPQVVGHTYGPAALAKGNSRGFFRVTAFRAVVQSCLFLAGFLLWGLPGALAGQGVAALLVYPAVVRLARQSDVWDKRHDLVFFALTGGLIVLALALHKDLALPLAP